jgi:hypothetical protein
VDRISTAGRDGGNGKQKEKKEEENITTDVYILGQCNQVENKKRKTIKDTAEQKCDQIKIREELIKTRYNVIVD